MRTFLIVALIAAPMYAHAASFDCAKAGTPLEKLICSDKDLNALDGDLGSAYKQALAAAKDKTALKNEQKQWIKTGRDACGTEKKCLVSAYKQRIAALRTGGAVATGDSGVFGTYVLSETLPFFDPTKNDMVSVTVNDCIRLAPSAQNDSITFSVETTGANGSYCMVSGTAMVMKEGYLFNKDSDRAAEGGCTLQIIVSDSAITLESSDCGYYCGALAHLDTSFKRNTRTTRSCGQ